MRDPSEPVATGGYLRPQQTWHCGLADEGPPCPLGPDSLGHCPAAAACRPIRDGDRWQCNRSTFRGGPCATGPGPDGACGITYYCTPVRSLRSRRGRFVAGVAMAAVGVLCMALSGSWQNEFISPGPLAAQHAQLIEGQTLRCAQCHAAADASARQWWFQATDGQPTLPAQSVLCLACHRSTAPEKFAMAAHGMSLDKLMAASGAPGTSAPEHRLREPHEPIACAACHQEHHGREHHLRAVDDASCQACHRKQFDSFAGSHPDFAAWPYDAPTRITFDHASHSLKHFPAEAREFACSTCHESDRFGVRQLTHGYEVTCAQCHDKSLMASLSEGVPLLSLPTIDAEALKAAGRPVVAWPAEASGDFEGVVPDAMALMLAADPQAARALGIVGAPYDLYKLDAGDATHVDAGAQLATATVSLVEELGARGPEAIAARLERIIHRQLTKPESTALQGQLTAGRLREFRDRWFSSTSSPAPTAGGDQANDLATISAGEWFRDDRTLSLRYRPTGHADAWMKVWLGMLAEAAAGPHAGLAEPLLRAALKPTAPGQCGQCHTIGRTSAGRYAIGWQALGGEDASGSFTRFSHAPHLLSTGADCTACHRIGSPAAANAGATSAAPDNPSAGFQPLTKSACAACHVPKIAGNACTQCHQYHAATYNGH